MYCWLPARDFYFIDLMHFSIAVLTTDTQINVGTIPDELRHVLEPMYP
jgi:hypothetical protein